MTVEYTKPGLAWLNDPNFRLPATQIEEFRARYIAHLPEASNMTYTSLQRSTCIGDAEHATSNQGSTALLPLLKGALCAANKHCNKLALHVA